MVQFQKLDENGPIHIMHGRGLVNFYYVSSEREGFDFIRKKELQFDFLHHVERIIRFQQISALGDVRCIVALYFFGRCVIDLY